MAAVEDINAYFSSISNLAAKFASDVELIQEICTRNGAPWKSLTVEEQEATIDMYMVDQKVADRYKPSRKQPTDDPPPNCFPVLKINSGEKIVIDFDHEEGWTWTDEHSAPFSWMSRSQQDLTFADLDEVLNPKEDPSKKSRFAKRPRSPDRSIWESPLVNGEKNKNEIEKMFEKFGIKMTSDEEAESQEDGTAAQADSQPASDNKTSEMESGVLFDKTASLYDNKSFVFDGDDGMNDSLNSSPSRQLLPQLDSSNVPRKSESGGSISGEKDKRKKHRDKKDKSDKEKKSKKEKRHRQKDVALSNPGGSVRHHAAAPRSGDISFGTVKLGQQAVYSLWNAEIDVEESNDEAVWGQDGRSSTEVAGIPFSNEMPSVHASCRTPQSVILPDFQPGESLTDDCVEHDDNVSDATRLELSTSELLPLTPPDADDSGVGSGVKTGFDFLDNW